MALAKGYKSATPLQRLEIIRELDTELAEVSATGNCGASSATGYKGASSVSDPTGVAVAWGHEARAKGDYFVLMVIGVDADHNVYVLDYVKERLTFNTQLNTIIDYGRNKFPMVERIGVETVAYQKSLAQELRA